MHWTGVDGAHDARGANRSALRRPAARVLLFWCWRLARLFHARASPPLRTRLDRSELAGLTHGEVRFALRKRGPVRFRASAGPRIYAVGLDLAVTGQAAFFPWPA